MRILPQKNSVLFIPNKSEMARALEYAKYNKIAVAYYGGRRALHVYDAITAVKTVHHFYEGYALKRLRIKLIYRVFG